MRRLWPKSLVQQRAAANPNHPQFPRRAPSPLQYIEVSSVTLSLASGRTSQPSLMARNDNSTRSIHASTGRVVRGARPASIRRSSTAAAVSDNPADLNSESRETWEGSDMERDPISLAIDRTIALLAGMFPHTSYDFGASSSRSALPPTSPRSSATTSILSEHDLDQLVAEVASTIELAQNADLQASAAASGAIEEAALSSVKPSHETQSIIDGFEPDLPGVRASSYEREMIDLEENMERLASERNNSRFQTEFLIGLRRYAEALSSNIHSRLESTKGRFSDDAFHPDAYQSVAKACYLSSFVVDPPTTPPNASVSSEGSFGRRSSSSHLPNKRFKNQPIKHRVADASRIARQGYETWLIRALRDWRDIVEGKGTDKREAEEKASKELLNSLQNTLGKLSHISVSLSLSNIAGVRSSSSDLTADREAATTSSESTFRHAYTRSKKALVQNALELSRVWCRVAREVDSSKEADDLETGVRAISSLGLLEEGFKSLNETSRIWDEAFKDSNASDADRERLAVFTADLVHRTLIGSQSALKRTLNAIVNDQRWRELYVLWDATFALISSQMETTNADTTTDEHQKRIEVLSLFMAAFVEKAIHDTRSGRGYSPLAYMRLNQILSVLPSPSHISVFHSLLNLYARSPGSFVPPVTLTPGPLNPLGRLAGTQTAREQTLNSLHAVWHRMREEGVSPDVKAYMLYMQGIGRKGDLRGLQTAWKELHMDKKLRQSWARESPRDPFPPLACFNHYMSILLSLPRSSNGVTLAMDVWNYLSDPKTGHQPDLFTVNTLLRHYSRKQDIDSMMDLMQKLPSMNLEPDVVTYTTVIKALLSIGDRSAAKTVLELMQKAGAEPNILTYSLLIWDLCKDGNAVDVYAAEKLASEMVKAGMKLNVVTWTTLVSGYFKAGLFREGILKLRNMSRRGIRPNLITYNIILRACASSVDDELMSSLARDLKARKGDSPTEVRESLAKEGICAFIIREMIGDNVQPNSDTWYIALSGLRDGRRWREADVVLGLMRELHFEPKQGSALARATSDVRDRRASSPRMTHRR